MKNTLKVNNDARRHSGVFLLTLNIFFHTFSCLCWLWINVWLKVQKSKFSWKHVFVPINKESSFLRKSSFSVDWKCPCQGSSDPQIRCTALVKGALPTSFRGNYELHFSSFYNVLHKNEFANLFMNRSVSEIRALFSAIQLPGWLSERQETT